jgi:hypothetical protein
VRNLSIRFWWEKSLAVGLLGRSRIIVFSVTMKELLYNIVIANLDLVVV